MSIPTKPWEVSNSGSVGGLSSINSGYQADRLHSSAIPYPGSGGGSVAAVSGAPALPPRPGQTRPLYSSGSVYNRSAMLPYSSYGGGSPYYSSGSSYYSPYSMGSYGMGGGGGFGGGYGGFYGNRMGMYGGYGTNPMNPDGQPTFSQLAEESSANAFQSIESFVSAFGSISAMLESTFHAVYSSFRAVVGVADHMGRLKHILSAMAVFRFFRWVIRRFLYLVGISKIKPEDVESLWGTLSGGVGPDMQRSELESELYPHSKNSSWPILMFLGFIMAGPYLMWKLISSLNLNANAKGAKGWATGQSDHFLAVAQYDFDGMADRELKLRSGQKIRLAPATNQPANVKGWVLASDGVKIGLVPTNYIKILGKRSGGSTDNEISMPPPSAPVTNQFGSHNMHPSMPSMAPGQVDEAAVPNPNIVITPPEFGDNEPTTDKLT
ncbi:unnamed protein product [Allacma fusca]|uniref:Peroxisomal membrane protein PEX13 n=1 Tax=Allacma fusca TaxID=39272 RepID=A0A8J2LXU8_9HEXA|nr:unnamed protein product [Allacma fusca]